MKQTPAWSIASIVCCLGIPLAMFLIPTGGGDGLENAITLLLAVAAGAIGGFACAIIGYVKKEQPRWANWVALALCALLVCSSSIFIL